MKTTNELRDVVQNLRNEANREYEIARKMYLNYLSTGESHYLVSSETVESKAITISRHAMAIVRDARIESL